eukprot:GFUD01001775.1.p1 GENE.GFUD01001775.1~~GFUD01001775.1.p1  ORF type:complete len:778 (+),score=227.17 GFUD01001775.1:185-2518(+)
MRPERNRTFSSDSGCDVQCDSLDIHSNSLESLVRSWEGRLGEVVRQEVKRAGEITGWATKALKHCGQEDDRRERILARWRRQMEGVLDFTNDLVECINNDTKEAIIETAERSSELDTSLIMEELEEEEEEEEGEELMQLFILSSKGKKKTFNKRGKSGIKCNVAISKKNGKHRSPKKASQELQNAYSKAIKERIRRHGPTHKDYPCHFDENDYNWAAILSVLEGEEIFEDWKWNLNESGIWDFDSQQHALENYQDNHKNEPKKILFSQISFSESDSNFWDERASIESSLIEMIDEEAEHAKFTEFESVSIHPKLSSDQAVIFVSQGQEKDKLTNWNVWDKFGVDWEQFEEEKPTFTVRRKYKKVLKYQNINAVFWKISLDHNPSRKEPRHLDVIRNLPVWDSPDIFLDSDDDLSPTEDKMMAKDPVNIFKSIRHIFNEPKKKCSQLKVIDSHILEDPSNWKICHKFGSSWDAFGVFDEPNDVINNSDDVNIVEAFWSISLDRSCCRKDQSLSDIILNLPVCYWPDVFTDSWNSTDIFIVKDINDGQKDPVNIFKSFRHIFSEPVDEKHRVKSRDISSDQHNLKDMNWANCDKYGKPWDCVVDHKQSVNVPQMKKKKTKVYDIDILEVFWNISLDKSCCITEKSLCEVIQNFPVWCSTDVFEDSWDVSETVIVKQNTNKQKKPVNIFKSFRKFFSESQKHKKKDKVKIKDSCGFQKVEDVFSDWMVNLFDIKSGKRKCKPDSLTEVWPEIGKKQRRDPSVEMAIQEYKLLKLLEDLKI